MKSKALSWFFPRLVTIRNIFKHMILSGSKHCFQTKKKKTWKTTYLLHTDNTASRKPSKYGEWKTYKAYFHLYVPFASLSVEEQFPHLIPSLSSVKAEDCKCTHRDREPNRNTTQLNRFKNFDEIFAWCVKWKLLQFPKLKHANNDTRNFLSGNRRREFRCELAPSVYFLLTSHLCSFGTPRWSLTVQLCGDS